jgi:NTP pyrophosphatase (non-canonical NTP hydrolase)
MTNKEKMRAITDFYEPEDICIQTMEECGELIQALAKGLRFKGMGQPVRGDVNLYDIKDDIAEEIADVKICLYELQYALELGGMCEFFKTDKIERSYEIVNQANKAIEEG